MTAQERGDAAVWLEEVGTYWRRRHILLLLAAANIVFTGAPVLGWSGMQVRGGRRWPQCPALTPGEAGAGHS